MNDARSGDGSPRTVVRVGDTVQRPAGYWTPAVHALLNHLEKVGFEGAPRVVGVGSGSEILTYVAGVTPGKNAAGWADEEILVSVGALLRATGAAWHWVPFSMDTMGGRVQESDWPARLRLFVDSYGLESRRRREVLFAAADLTRRMRDNRGRDGLATDPFDQSLAALDRQRQPLLDALE